ncbi:hypothetical protein NMY22_g5181 [Coprinellus aureogranulatus]|nr:hypothetical protein NMY22_g5181 [Coprinellus aureogranulatus]
MSSPTVKFESIGALSISFATNRTSKIFKSALSALINPLVKPSAAMTSLHVGSDLPPPDLDVTPCPGFLLASSRTESTDIAHAFGSDAEKRSALAIEIRDACVNVGFFYARAEVKNHGIAEEKIEKTIEAARQFFALPEEIKMTLDIHKSSNYKGYTALLGENTDVTGNGDLHEGFDIGFEPSPGSPNIAASNTGSMSGENIWPNELPGFKDAVMEYYHAALNLGRVLFPLFALALDLPETWFDDKTKESATIMRLLHYPPQNPTKIQEGQIGIGEHTDYEVGIATPRSESCVRLTAARKCFTLLWQDKCGGLQVKNASGKWIDAVPIPGTIVFGRPIRSLDG